MCKCNKIEEVHRINAVYLLQFIVLNSDVSLF